MNLQTDNFSRLDFITVLKVGVGVGIGIGIDVSRAFDTDPDTDSDPEKPLSEFSFMMALPGVIENLSVRAKGKP